MIFIKGIIYSQPATIDRLILCQLAYSMLDYTQENMKTGTDYD